MKRALAGSLASLFLVSGCATVKSKPVVNPIKVPPPKKIKTVEYFKGKAFIKRTYLVQKPADALISVDFKGGTLRDFADYLSGLGFAVSYDPVLSARQVPAVRGTMTLRDLIEKVAFETNCYWEADGRFVRFEKDRIVVYQFPMFSSSLLKAIYGFEDSDSVLKAFRGSFFDVLEKNLRNILSYDVSGTVSVTQKVEYADQSSEKFRKAKAYSVSASREKNSGNSVEKKEKNSGSRLSENTAKREKTKDSEYNSKNEKRKNRPVFAVVNGEKGSENSSNREKREKKQEVNRTLSTGITKDSKVSRNRTTQKERLGESTEREEVIRILSAQYKEGKGRFAVVPSLGELIVRVTPLEERKVDELVREMSREVLGKMVAMKVYVVGINRQKGLDYSLFVKALKRAYRHQATFEIGSSNQVNVDFTSLSSDYLSGIAHGIDVTSIVNYIISTGHAKLISSLSLLTVPRMPARISSVTEIPYAVPTSISQGGTNPTLTYEIKTVDDGFKLRIVPSVLDDGTIVMGIGLKENKYLGDKDVKAGNVGTVTLPVQAPRELSTVVRCRPGDVVFIGGIRKYQEKLSGAMNLGIPYKKNSDREYSELYILIQPKLIIFGEKTKG